jgi:periplasmic mercuric ion binding protein
MMKKLLFVLASFAFLPTAHSDTIKASINGMVCAFCAQGIEKNLQATGKTKEIFVSLKQKIVAAELKEGEKISHDDFKALVKDSGYIVTKIETVKLSANEIRAATKP